MLHKAITFVVICKNKSQKLRPFPLQRMVAAVTRMYRIEKKNGWQQLISFFASSDLLFPVAEGSLLPWIGYWLLCGSPFSSWSTVYLPWNSRVPFLPLEKSLFSSKRPWAAQQIRFPRFCLKTPLISKFLILFLPLLQQFNKKAINSSKNGNQIPVSTQEAGARRFSLGCLWWQEPLDTPPVSVLIVWANPRGCILQAAPHRCQERGPGPRSSLSVFSVLSLLILLESCSPSPIPTTHLARDPQLQIG